MAFFSGEDGKHCEQLEQKIKKPEKSELKVVTPGNHTSSRATVPLTGSQSRTRGAAARGWLCGAAPRGVGRGHVWPDTLMRGLSQHAWLCAFAAELSAVLTTHAGVIVALCPAGLLLLMAASHERSLDFSPSCGVDSSDTLRTPLRGRVHWGASVSAGSLCCHHFNRFVAALCFANGNYIS